MAEIPQLEMTHGNALLPRSFREETLTIVRAVGMYLVTNDGRKILDASSGAAVSSLGPEPNPRVEEAIARQRQNISYICSYSGVSEITPEYARALIATTYGHFKYVGFYGSGRLLCPNTVRLIDHATGSTAVEAAAKLALQYWKECNRNKTIFITRLRSYHGATLAALSLGGHEGRREPFRSGLMENVSHVSPCNPYRDKTVDETDASYIARLSDELHEEIVRLGPENVAAFMVEPIVGAVSTTVCLLDRCH
jgi:adenosylmethionine-8-amino-7-oxononanoate aminotransferase